MSGATYPGNREADVVLHDGSTVSLRPVRPDDGAVLEKLFAGLDPDSQGFRFFSGAADPARAGRLMAEVDYRSRYGLLAFRGQDHRPVGHGVYLEIDPSTAEVAFAVADDFQGRGLGTILLAHLAETAGDNGIATFRAEVMPSNHRMIEMFRESGFPVEIESSPEGLGVEFPTSLTPKAVTRFEERDTIAARAAVDGFLRPRSVAIVGASRRRGTVGGEVLHNLIESPFEGPIYPVNPSADSVQSVPAFASVSDDTGGRRPRRDRGQGRGGGGHRARMRRQGRQEPGRPLGGLHRGRRGGRRAGTRAPGGLPRGRDEADRAQLPRPPRHRFGGGAQRQLRPRRARRRQRRLRDPERRSRAGADRVRRGEGDRRLDLRFARQSRRHDGDRPARVLGGGREHAARPALHRVVQQPGPVRAGREAGRQEQARRSGQERAVGGRRASRELAHRRAAGGVRPHRRRPLRAVRRDPRRDAVGAARRRLAALDPAAAGGTPGRDRHQRGRAGDHVRRRLRCGRPRSPSAAG